jgi:Protein of unknown function (DUF4012)
MKAPAFAFRQPRPAVSTRSRRRHRALWALAIVFVILACSGAASVLAYMSVKSQANQLQAQLAAHLQIGQSELETAKVSLKTANSNHDEKLIAETNVHFTTAKLQFAIARQMADSSQLLQQLESLPTVGELAQSRHTAVDGIADMGIAISDAGLELTKLDGQLIAPASAGGQQGRTLLTVLNQTNSSLVIVRKDLDLAQKAAASVDIRIVPTTQQASFLRAKGTITTAIAAADQFSQLVPIITEILGGNGVRTYLIEQVNPAELRAGGGFIGTYSVLQANQGTLKLLSSGDAYNLVDPRPSIGQRGYVAPPGPLEESLLPTISWSFVDSNFFPDFPSNAIAAENFVQPRLGAHIDAVISMDYYTVAKMLELTGPINVPGYKITVNASNFVSLVADLYRDEGPTHKAILAATAGPLMDRISTLPPDRWPALIMALNDLALGRHMQAYFNSAGVEKQVDQFGWSNTLNPTGAPDYVMEIESNLGGTKANYFLVRRFTLDLTRAGAVLHHKVTIELVNNTPFSYRPQEYYRAYLRLYVSATASSPGDNLRAVKYPDPAPPAGTKLIDGWLPLFHGYGHSADAIFEYDTPWVSDGRGEGQMYWQKQPGTVSDIVVVRWNDGSGHAYSASADLGQDRTLLFSSRGLSIGPGKPAQAQLPSLSLG